MEINSTQQFLALTSPGIEILLAQELSSLGAENVVQKPEGVYFSTSILQAYQICIWTRYASRVLLQLSASDADNKETLHQAASEVVWSEVFESDTSFAVDFVGKSSEIRNSQFGGLTVKDAIVDHFRDLGLARPNVDKYQPEIRIQARLLKGRVSFYLDFSGRSLFQRGYRETTGAAPLKENLAAAIITRSGWLDNQNKPLIDPMCGSGTLLIEAVSMAIGCAANIRREQWGFSHWLQHDELLWQTQYEQAYEKTEEALKQFNGKVYGYDSDGRVLKAAKQNARNAGFSDFIEFTEADANHLTNKFSEGGYIVFNPPYGERIGELPELVETFVHLGQSFKENFDQWKVAIFTANTELLTLLKLSSKKRYKFKNGPLDCQLACYDINDKQREKDQITPQSHFDGKDSAFANRLLKNRKNLKSWLKKEHVECYRLYDADIPEYNVAVDVYGDYLVIQEYVAPANIDPSKAAKRLQEVLYFAPKTLNVPADKVVIKTRAKQKGTNQYQKLAQKKQAITLTEYGAKFSINLWDYLDTGLFLDHRKTRQLVAEKAKHKSLLNLFAYTGSVSVQAALHGAKSITTVDMSNTYLTWAQENFRLNNLSGEQYQFVQADCLAWLKENKQSFDVIFIDPPTFSNSKRMEDSFDVQRDHLDVITDALGCLHEKGEIIFTNNKRNFKIDHEGLSALGFSAKNISEQTRDKDFQRNKHIHNSWLITRASQ
ncbi:bifunctional 23S rRNA (guanine(2069)-N(7))-methyltransferase RlmK/23S rRNA (guanine(2445)-N(2))-methyltransferase RlmL [Thalassotalea sp. 1_MG-2023]|uniref:bifunctional 23S rRNA (guanine(2069)-N(7))-methyltransferase RlmK/23S rRNA (guanine(2445)-N(2))-methyltransferase RlmL n=1 Tax=Thalassotalea sp. 1_MG-2023 TaxID=3062680 RepID=UPI0026E3C04B|nr:bifunctional 23S rRNA (guanine(2069)-N(7))-methyltransferase RlmK/23S rRNA (guanine(2445)-N(2))-methyltransferase RlmL [Thalassotalea sp. 1_MG-2023]MDO6428848.1 bifunctional 23S rRNA (guanine(2069)-N(7))-methyltransferase RlmK/23S rRNA (guanine(2445)-N(2))-methyltransferase RlmL [Thalassotalea sp. 1_MG-2023]